MTILLFWILLQIDAPWMIWVIYVSWAAVHAIKLIDRWSEGDIS